MKKFSKLLAFILAAVIGLMAFGMLASADPNPSLMPEKGNLTIHKFLIMIKTPTQPKVAQLDARIDCCNYDFKRFC